MSVEDMQDLMKEIVNNDNLYNKDKNNNSKDNYEDINQDNNDGIEENLDKKDHKFEYDIKSKDFN